MAKVQNSKTTPAATENTKRAGKPSKTLKRKSPC